MEEKTGRLLTRVCYDTWMSFWRGETPARLSVRLSVFEILSQIDECDVNNFIYVASGRVYDELEDLGLPAVRREKPFLERIKHGLDGFMKALNRFDDKHTRGSGKQIPDSPFGQSSEVSDERSFDWQDSKREYLRWLLDQPEPANDQLDVIVSNIQNVEAMLRQFLQELMDKFGRDQGGPPETISLIKRFQIVDLIDRMRIDGIDGGVDRSKAQIYREIAPRFGVSARTIKRVDLEERKLLRGGETSLK